MNVLNNVSMKNYTTYKTYYKLIMIVGEYRER